MMKKGKRLSRDPYYYWKVVNMILACAVLILSLLILFGEHNQFLIPAAFFLGTLMCILSGIMELAKGKKLVGYVSSVLAGVLGVIWIASIIWLWMI